jgi:GT2 family glycosyltransferase
MGNGCMVEGVMVSVCVVNWNSRELLRRCLASLVHQDQGVSLEVVVVDNGSWDGAAEMVARDFGGVRLIRNEGNRGYAAACNQGWRASCGRYVLFLNNDTEVPAGTLGKLVEVAERYGDGVLFAPRLRGWDGGVQVSWRGELTLGALWHRVGWLRWTGWYREAYERYRRGGGVVVEGGGGGVVAVEAVLGCAVLVRRGALEAVGGWDEGYRFGVEDLELCRRLRGHGRLYYVGSVEVVHYGRVASRENIGYVVGGVACGYVRYLRQSGVGGWRLWLYKAAVTVDVPWQCVVKGVEGLCRWVVGRRDGARRSWLAMRGAWGFLRGGLVGFWRS